jgi:hypothetical protein
LNVFTRQTDERRLRERKGERETPGNKVVKYFIITKVEIKIDNEIKKSKNISFRENKMKRLRFALIEKS